MKYVLDASVGVKAVLPEVDSDKAIQLLDEYRQEVHDLIAPDFYPVEIAHSITRAERQKRLTPLEGAVALKDILSLLPRLQESVPILSRAYEISSQARTGVYDCVYLSLAERENCEFVTADDKLIAKFQAQFSFIRALSTMP